MSTSKVIGSIFLAADELLRVKELAIASSSHFIDNSGLEINENGTRDVLSCTCLTKKGVESIVSSAYTLITRHLAIRLNAMLEAVKLPACIADLNTGLTDVD
uniref:Tubulin alpha chain-like isoform X2 n=1 Tax=Rhizophora mucronata TaxID=61149 RepID=A0A2P2IXW7_RHIMU